ncbi:MAG TPA: PilZ domain-containing protein [Polyangia bacterium]|nr:PilZ domain-containing protein [Polyangia bacterium]
MATQSDLPFPPVDGEASSEDARDVATSAIPALRGADQREHLRFDKMFSVRVESLLFGEIYCVARNISAGGVFLEIADPLPLGATVRVCFPVPDGSGEVVATGEVKNHYFINFTQGGSNRAVAGMAVRFTAFESEGHSLLSDCLAKMRVLH